METLNRDLVALTQPEANAGARLKLVLHLCILLSADPLSHGLRAEAAVGPGTCAGGWFRLGCGRCELQSKPGVKMVDLEPCKEIPRRISAAIYGWDGPLLTFIHPRFEHVAHVEFGPHVLHNIDCGPANGP